MTEEKTFWNKDKQMGLAMILANYAKRKLEGVYDGFAETDFGQTLKNMNRESKYALELALYFISALADRKLDEKSFWSKIVKEIGVDATPELAKRFLDEEKSAQQFAGKNGLTETILEMENDSILELISWLSSLDETEKNSTIKKIEKLSREKLEKILKLDRKNRSAMLDLLSEEKKPPRKNLSGKIEKQLDAIIRNLKKWGGEKNDN